jgi:hypothetical protein
MGAKLSGSDGVSRVSGDRLWPRAQALGAEQFVARSAVRRDRGQFSGHFLSPLTGLRVGSWRPTAGAVGHLIPPLAGLSEG